MPKGDIRIRRISEAILNLIDTSKNAVSALHIDKILTQSGNILPGLIDLDALIIRIVDCQNPRLLAIESSKGIPAGLLNALRYTEMGVGIEGNAAKSRSHIIVKRMRGEGRIRHAKALIECGLQSALSVPIVFDSEVYGTMTIFSKSQNKYADKDVFLLLSFSTIIAIALKNACLYRNLKSSYINTINSLVMIMESRDSYMRGHSERVTYVAVEIARHMKLPESDLDILRTAGKLHDIGKITIPDRILNKKSALTPSEWAEIHMHPVKGVEMVLPLKFIEAGMPLIRNHHERFDGCGYPDGLRGSSIPLLSRILSVADAFDAMTSKRPYRRPLSIDEAMDELEDKAGSQFDPSVIKAFTKIVRVIH